MKAIFTGDFQSEWTNLDLCTQAWDEVLHIANRRSLDTIVFVGDGKQAYNPIDGRVVKWWQKAISRAKEQGKKVIYVKGNHDRFGRYKNAGSWLSILKKAGAIVFSNPGEYDTGDGKLFILPYSSDEEAKQNAKLFKPNKSRDILVFHHDINKARYNQQGNYSDGKLSLRDIRADRYRYCISGHIHLPQKIENVYYTGSPFCMDWGEVNQRKRYIVVGEGNKLTSIDSRIPRWFDPDVDGFKSSKPESWSSARIRIQVKCDPGSDYGRTIERARKKAEGHYPGADIFVIPRFEDRRHESSKIRISDSDDTKVKEYVRRTFRGSRRAQKHVIDYMLRSLAHYAGGLRTTDEVKFRKAKGTNFLPFRSVEIDFRKPGINVIQGINYDRLKKSNGSGKTSLVQILPVAMFGKTFKDQAHDRWSNRRTTEPALAEISLKNYKGRIKIIRGRRPPLLQMFINGKSVSTGMKTTDKGGTQLQIEQLTGYTWQTLANAVYIDRTVSDAFLSGTKKQRTEVLSRFQNLERFDKALQLVKKDSRQADDKIHNLESMISHVRGKLSERKRSLQNIKALSKVQTSGAQKEYEKRKKEYKKLKSSTKSERNRLIKIANKLKKKYEKAAKIEQKAVRKYIIAHGRYNDFKFDVEKTKKMAVMESCPTCFQPVTHKWIDKHIRDQEDRLINLKTIMEDAVNDRSEAIANTQSLDGKYSELRAKADKYIDAANAAKLWMNQAYRQWLEVSSESHSAKQLVDDIEHRLKNLRRKYDKYKDMYKKLKRKMYIYQYTIEAFSREGIPAFLNRELCPVLNKAANYYAEAFSDNEIQLRFVIDEGEFVPVIINAKGGEGISDQSTGERALAGLIASFALREIAPKCNLLILDEPGDGLDEQTARQFAKALQQMKDRLGSIWIATHNVHVLSELSGENIVTVKKENGISRITSS
jgi:DNA repair exonuclease SbcCD nuclease subunit